LKPRTTNKRFLAVLASLAAWREREAQARDIPRGRVLKDEALSEIAAHPPETPEALERIRAVPKGFANSRLGKGLTDAIAIGLTAQPPQGAIDENKLRRRREPSPAVVDLLKTLLRLRAEAAHVEIDKSARFTDWSHRPLSKRQLEYALADVTHLRVIYEWMKARLEKTGRASWVAEDVAALQDPALYRIEPEQAWKRLKPRTTNKRFLAVLASLAAWREREAQARDIPRGRVLKDEALSEIAAHSPETPEALERIRAVPKGFANSRLGKGLIEAITEGLSAQPPQGAIDENKQRRRREPSPAVVDLLKTLLRLRAEAAHVAPRLIANAEDIERLAANEDDGVAALHGWRNDVFGKDAVALRKGDLAIALENGEAVVVELEAEVGT